MTDKTIVYGKQTDRTQVPVTVRVEWLPDGTIKPCMYWMPDESCHQIKHIYECTPLAFLKDRVEGLRFKVSSDALEVAEPFIDYDRTRHETYLYFADKRFCDKNIIDQRYGHAGKEYIPVTLDVFPNGDYEIVYFWVSGARYMVERTISVEPRGSFHAGGVGVWHKVDARQVNADNDEDPDPENCNRRIAALYFEINKWFVTIKTGERKDLSQHG